ncbi:MAG: TonB-dependent receptor plug domain-containing protein [Rhodocyclaceae bacterium]|nr:TonB-dependent receptor plug domain-containing protein [Rhodocyclaceae bacterium]
MKVRTAFRTSLLCTAIASLPSFAQTTNLGAVVVTAPRDEALGSRVGEEELLKLRSATSDAASLLRDVPGVSLYGAGGVSSLPSIHGLADDRLRIKVDGMDLISACANHMNPALSYIDPTDVGSIKAYAGITPVSVGGDSIGGAIVVASKPPRFAKAGAGLLADGEVGAFYRSNGDGRGGHVAATLATETLSLGYSNAISQADNYSAAKDFKAGTTQTGTVVGSHWIAGDEVGSSRYKTENQALNVALRNENHLLDLKLGFQHIPYEGFPSQHMDMTDNRSRQVDLGYTGKYQWGVLEARVYQEHTRHKMNFGEDKNFYTLGMPMDTEGDNSGASVKATLPLSARDTLKLGSEYQRYRLNDWWDPVGSGGMAPSQFQNIHDGKRDHVDLFAEWDAQWSEQWLTQLGMRASRVAMAAGTVQGYKNNIPGVTTYDGDRNAFNSADRNRTDHNLDLTALASYTQSANATFEGGYSRKTRSPNLYERYTWSTGGMAMAMNNLVNDGNGYVGNLNLRPEVAHTLSFTADWHDAAAAGWALKATPYLSYVDDFIDARRCPAAAISATSVATTCNNTTMQTKTNAFVDLQFLNQSARLYGVDVSGHLPLAQTDSYGSLALSGVLSYVRGINRTTGGNLYNIMPLNTRLALTQQTGSWTNTAEWQLVAAKRDVNWVRDEMQTSGYGLVNLRSSYAWKRARLDVGIENLLNKFYALPLGGAYIGQGSTMSLNGAGAPWGIPVPGMGRSIYTALTLKF